MADAITIDQSCAIIEAAAAALASGELTKHGDDRAKFKLGLDAAASGDRVAQQLAPLVAKVTKASGVTFSAGGDVYWDASANTAVNPGLALDGSADFYVGRAWKAAATGDDHVQVELNAASRHERLRPFAFEFDCDGANGDTDEHVLIPASQNPHGLVLLQAFGVVTEVMAGTTEDQGVVTVEDEDDNVLSAITAADLAADAVGDYLAGTNGVWAMSSGAALKFVAAGKAVQGFVSQQTSGITPAGKIKVYVLAIPLV